MAWPAALASSAASSLTSKPPWRIIPRPVLETILNNFSNHLRVPQPLLLHGPRGTGKTSLLLHRLLPQWNNSPHAAAYVDFASAAAPLPWTTSSPPPVLPRLTDLLDAELEAMAERAARLGAIGSSSVFAAVHKWHGIAGALRRIIGPGRLTERDESGPVSALWSKAVVGFAGGVGEEAGEEGYVSEALGALRVAKEVVGMHGEWRRKAVAHVRGSGGFSRSLANSATDWPCLLIQILSDAAEIDFFQVFVGGFSSN